MCLFHLSNILYTPWQVINSSLSKIGADQGEYDFWCSVLGNWAPHGRLSEQGVYSDKHSMFFY